MRLRFTQMNLRNVRNGGRYDSKKGGSWQPFTQYPLDPPKNIKKPNISYHKYVTFLTYVCVSGGTSVRFSDIFRGIKREHWEEKR